ncbi:putative flavoprotein [Sarocladium strictum]
MNHDPEFDVLIIGSGLSGISSIYHLRKIFPSWRIKAFEAADEVGGTWYFNRYPGARFDSESVSYHLSWDKDYLQQWDWKEEFAPQSEILKYIQGFCDKNDIRKSVQFNTEIKTARWQAGTKMWVLEDANRRTYTARFVITGVGILSAPQLPKITGIENFKGSAFHTSRWPRDFDYTTGLVGKRVGVIGTAATGIQTITAISQVEGLKSLTVFQRTASWCAPLRNKPIQADTMKQYKAQYDAIFDRCAKAPAGFLYSPDPRCLFDVPKEEREALWEKLYSEPGFGKWLSVFKDTYTNPEANKEYSDWMAAKMRARVHDPVVAEKLIPKDHGFGTKRVPLESGYFEAFNKPHVYLVDLRETPITTVSSDSIITADGKEHELDVLVYATGFDAITGAISAIRWCGEDDRPLFGPSRQPDGKTTVPEPIWPDHNTKTFLGLMAPSLPNVFMILGPHQPYGNVPRSIENATTIVMDLLQFVHDNGYQYVDPTPKAAEEWYQHVVKTGEGLLASLVSGWATGVNTNQDGRSERKIAKYSGTYQQWLSKCRESQAAGWKGLNFV